MPSNSDICEQIASALTVSKGVVVQAPPVGSAKFQVALSALDRVGAYPLIAIAPLSLSSSMVREVERLLPGRKVLSVKDVDDISRGEPEIVVINFDKLLAQRGMYRGALSMLYPAGMLIRDSERTAGFSDARFERLVEASMGTKVVLTGWGWGNRPLATLRSQLELIGRLDLWQETLGYSPIMRSDLRHPRPWEVMMARAQESSHLKDARKLVQAMRDNEILIQIDNLF